MKQVAKRLVGSKILRLILSVILIYFAFRKVDVVSLVGQLALVPWWFVILMIGFNYLVLVVGAYRWCLLLFPKPGIQEVLNFSRSQLLGGFYGMFFPSGMAGDIFKWLPLLKKYPDISKAKMFSSVLLDRIIGFSAFIIVAFVAALVGKWTGFVFPEILLLVFGGLFLATVLFYVLVFTTDLKKILRPIPYLNKINHIVDLLKQEDKLRILKCTLVAFVTEFMWFTSIWFVSLIFNAGITLLAVYIFLPVITLILLLPISFAGFGARETLFLMFFSQVGVADEKILLVSTMSGILGIIGTLLGGLILLI